MGSKTPEYHLYFVKAKKIGKLRKLKTNVYIVRKDDNKGFGQRLGLIKWHGGWWQYVFYPDSETFWNYKCLEQVAEFLDEINDKQRKKWRKSNG